MEQQPPYQPGFISPTEYARQAAAARSYTTPAIITLALYFLFWIPGVIANIVYLNAARQDKQQSGLDPQGRGCLIALAIVFVGLPLAAFIMSVGVSAIGILFSVASSSTVR